MIYLASPYSHVDADVRERRYVAACRAAAELMRRGHIVFSPIAHSHGIAVHGDVGQAWPAWKEFDLAMLDVCDSVVVLTLDGWQESVGVQEEITYARERGYTVIYWDGRSDLEDKEKAAT